MMAGIPYTLLCVCGRVFAIYKMIAFAKKINGKLCWSIISLLGISLPSWHSHSSLTEMAETVLLGEIHFLSSLPTLKVWAFHFCLLHLFVALFFSLMIPFYRFVRCVIFLLHFIWQQRLPTSVDYEIHLDWKMGIRLNVSSESERGKESVKQKRQFDLH